ncbi:divergent PAP2 family protein [Paenibacillus sp. KQZ6P-2]|uniref:Divergent PAP2 family protein n=1 Tax=Paenibacillus mangrovi TaxID=2931978 RepID=A0A9X1WS46_9BACL|nr:divergent PAP2 family protein [Paenibacillus mangrovi]MCJ8013626.1 divergent PAP2 family protein [Paenibacillus mangrovi]
MDIFINYPLIAALTSILLAQFIKVPLHFVKNRSWNFGLAFSTGGMPSSHSAAVTSLSTAVGIYSGISSVPFAIAVLFSAIIMFDAAGVRRYAGEHAVILNRFIEEFQHLFQEQPGNQKIKVLKELLGHRPIEVIVGGILGIGISLVLYAIYYR